MRVSVCLSGCVGVADGDLVYAGVRRACLVGWMSVSLQTPCWTSAVYTSTSLYCRCVPYSQEKEGEGVTSKKRGTKRKPVTDSGDRAGSSGRDI